MGEKAREVLGALISCEIALSCFYFGLQNYVIGFSITVIIHKEWTIITQTFKLRVQFDS